MLARKCKKIFKKKRSKKFLYNKMRNFVSATKKSTFFLKSENCAKVILEIVRTTQSVLILKSLRSSFFGIPQKLLL